MKIYIFMDTIKGVGCRTYWVISLGDIDKIRNHLIADPILNMINTAVLWIFSMFLHIMYVLSIFVALNFVQFHKNLRTG